MYIFILFGAFPISSKLLSPSSSSDLLCSLTNCSYASLGCVFIRDDAYVCSLSGSETGWPSNGEPGRPELFLSGEGIQHRLAGAIYSDPPYVTGKMSVNQWRSWK